MEERKRETGDRSGRGVGGPVKSHVHFRVTSESSGSHFRVTSESSVTDLGGLDILAFATTKLHSQLVAFATSCCIRNKVVAFATKSASAKATLAHPGLRRPQSASTSESASESSLIFAGTPAEVTESSRCKFELSRPSPDPSRGLGVQIRVMDWESGLGGGRESETRNLTCDRVRILRRFATGPVRHSICPARRCNKTQ